MNVLKLLRPGLCTFRRTRPHPAIVATTQIRQVNSAAKFATNEPIFTVSGEGMKLQAAWSTENPPSIYHAVWLRHNCQCAECLTSNNQRSITTTTIDPNVAVADFKTGM